MQFFKDSVTGKVHAFEDDVMASLVGGIYSFTGASGKKLATPATLEPFTPPAVTPADALAAAQARQDVALTRACREVILGGFTSSALGMEYRYPSLLEDQVNLFGAAVMQASQVPLWCRNAGGMWALMMHTPAQVAQAASDLRTMIAAAQTKLAALRGAVATETSVAAVQAITW